MRNDDEAYLTDDDPYARRTPEARQPRMEPDRGTLILVLGILSITICQLCGPFAWMLGNEDMRKIRAGRMNPAGEGNTNAGRILGMIGTLLMVAGLLFFLVFMLFFAVNVGTSERLQPREYTVPSPSDGSPAEQGPAPKAPSPSAPR